MRIFQFIQNRRGFSLVGMMVGVALLGILTAGMMRVFSNMALNQNYVKFRAEVDNFGEELRAQLGVKEICTQTFAGINLSPTAPNTPIPAIKDASGHVMFAAPSPTALGDNSFIISSIALKNQPATNWYVEDNPISGAGRVFVQVTYHAVGPVSGPSDSYRTYTLATHRNLTTSVLTDCSALGKSAGDGVWRYTNSDIYFNTGNVGIGTTAPLSALDVNGAIHPGSATKGNPCVQEGSFAYDTAAHVALLCDQSLHWNLLSSSCPHHQVINYVTGCSGGVSGPPEYNPTAVGCNTASLDVCTP